MTWKELLELAKEPDFSWHIKKMCDDGSIMEWFPEAFWLDNYIHSAEHHPEGNPLDHTLKCLQLADDFEFDPLSKIAVLFHDVGKAVSAIKYDKEKHPYHAFYNHEKNGLPVFECIVKRMDIPEKEAECIAFCIRYHMRSHRFHKMREQTVVETVLSPYWPTLKNVSYVDAASRLGNFDKNEVVSEFKYAEEVTDKFCQRFLLDGDD